MSANPIITNTGILFACFLMSATILVTQYFRLQFSKALFINSIRMLVQLTLVGGVLAFVFKQENYWWSALCIFVMIFAATQTGISRIQWRYQKIRSHFFIAVALSCFGVGLYALTFCLDGEAWKRSSVYLPLMGMLTGNALNNMSLGFDYWMRALVKQRERIEYALSHGSSRSEAVYPLFRESMNTGMLSIINSMGVAGVVSLPGAMTGQILAGTDPHEAVKYQIVIFFMVTIAAMFGVSLAIYLSYRTLTNTAHQVLYSQITEKFGDE
jgi:putative ABC transport system permease protein